MFRIRLDTLHMHCNGMNPTKSTPINTNIRTSNTRCHVHIKLDSGTEIEYCVRIRKIWSTCNKQTNRTVPVLLSVASIMGQNQRSGELSVPTIRTDGVSHCPDDGDGGRPRKLILTHHWRCSWGEKNLLRNLIQRSHGLQVKHFTRQPFYISKAFRFRWLLKKAICRKLQQAVKFHRHALHF